MRDFEIATNESVVFFNSDVLRPIREADTRLKSRKAACTRCHIIPGIAEPTIILDGHVYDVPCARKVRRAS